ncbi:unnamed protein product [Camellia sinensis]
MVGGERVDGGGHGWHSWWLLVMAAAAGGVVVVVGNFMSGQDISMELVDVAKEVHLSAKSLDISEGLSKFISKHDNIHLHPVIDFLQEDGKVLFVDGCWVIADTIIYCTGYSYSFPFLDTKGIVEVHGNRVEHLRVVGLPFFESQGKWIAELLSGKRTLPSRDVMMHSIMEFYHQRNVDGIPKYRTHDIGNFEYSDEYADHTGFPHLEEWRKELSLSAIINSYVNLETYRDSYEHDLDLLQLTLQDPYFAQLRPQDAKLSIN